MSRVNIVLCLSILLVISSLQASAQEFIPHKVDIQLETVIGLQFSDFDEDGDLDIFVSTADGTIGSVPFPNCGLYFLENDGEGEEGWRTLTILFNEGDFPLFRA